MIYEIRTYDIRPQRVPEYQKRFEAKLAGREEFSPLFGHWYTEIGPLNQIVAIWPYESLASRAETRAAPEASGKWPPDTADQIVGMTSRIFAARGVHAAAGRARRGPDLRHEDLHVPGGGGPDRAGPVGGGHRKEDPDIAAGGLLVLGRRGRGQLRSHVGVPQPGRADAYPRRGAGRQGIWPAPGFLPPDRQENKILLPASFSPIR